MRTPVKFWKCGCITLFYKSKGNRSNPNLGFLLHKCGQCKLIEPILAELLKEEKAVQEALAVDAAYRAMSQGATEKKLDVWG